jgi:hypothetical protein
VVFFLPGSDLLVIQIVEDHWFHAVFLYRGRIVQFVLLDAENELRELARVICVGDGGER